MSVDVMVGSRKSSLLYDEDDLVSRTKHTHSKLLFTIKTYLRVVILRLSQFYFDYNSRNDIIKQFFTQKYCTVIAALHSGWMRR